MHCLRNIALLMTFTLVAIATSSPATAQDLVQTIFSASEKQIIDQYYGRDRKAERDAQTTDKPGQGQKGNKGKGKGKGKGAGKAASSDAAKGKSSEMPKGLAQRSELPPGLQKQLERNGTLPPGLEKRALPGDLSSLLPNLLPGTERIIVDRDIVLVDAATNVVLDVMRDVLMR